jgi:formamidopyrimidine-DNA glycosylase
MPELAEVEYYRKKWNKGLGKKILKVRLNSQKRIFRGCNTRSIRKLLEGSTLRNSWASGKQMLFQFNSDRWLGLHLGMTGELFHQSGLYHPEKHDHLVLYTRHHAFVFSDARLFGRILFLHQKDPPDWWVNRPVDILSPEFTFAYLESHINQSRRPVKAILLDQSIFPGVGNWMADEILWRSRIRPNRRYHTLKKAEYRELWKRTRQVCRDAMRVIAPDWSTPPNSWLFNHRWKDGGTCPKTKKPLRRETIAGRTTCFSPAWQR